MVKKEPIRILHVVQRMEAAGVQSFIMNVYRQIDRNEVQFDFLTHYSEQQFYDDEIEALGGHIYRLTVREDKNFVKYIHDLNNFFSEHREYQVVHGHMDSLGVFYLGAAKKAGIAVRIAHAHTLIEGGGLKKQVRNFINRFYKIYATKLLACSEEAGRYMFGRDYFTVVHNPIEVEKFKYDLKIRKQTRELLGLENSLVIGNVGRFAKEKNHKFLLDIFKEILVKRQDAKLLLIGKGETLEETMQYAESLGVKNEILYLGIRDDVNRLYQAMDIFVFPSVYEGLGIVAIEAQAAGLPTICSDKVPDSAKVTDLFCQLSLNDSKKTWSDKVISEAENIIRTDRSKKIIDSGYDVRFVSKQLVGMYHKLIGGGYKLSYKNGLVFIPCYSPERWVAA